MSKELLKRVGTFIYGEEWQAPLARDLGVNERSMRRWVAGTDEIPRGVWRDLGDRLEIWHRALGHLVSAVKHTSGLVEVHAFKVLDGRLGDMVQPRGKSTAERIAKSAARSFPAQPSGSRRRLSTRKAVWYPQRCPLKRSSERPKS